MPERLPPATVGRDDRLLLHYSVYCQGQELEASPEGEAVEITMSSGEWPLQLELAMLEQPAGAQLSVPIEASENAFG